MENAGSPVDKSTEHKYLAGIIAAGLLLYGCSLAFGFNYLDDSVILVYQEFLRNAANALEIFRRDVMFSPDGSALYYRPLPNLLLMLQVHLGGAAPFAYRLTNVLLHALASCLVFKLLVRMRYSGRTAFFFALVFLAHPAAAQTVCWIPGSNASLLAVLALAVFISAVDFWETGRARCAAAHAFFFACAMLSKESAAALVPLCLLYRYFINRKTIFTAGVPIWAGWALGMSAWLALRSLALPMTMPVTGGGMFRSFAGNLPVLAAAFGDIALPFRIAVMAVPRDINIFPGLAAALLLGTAFFFSKNRRSNFAAFGVCWFLLLILPCMVSPMPAASNFMPHRLYLSIVGVLFVFFELDWVKDAAENKAAGYRAAFLVLLAALTLVQVRHYRDRRAFWERAAADSPHSVMANVGLGTTLEDAGEITAAETAFRKGLALDASDVNGNYNLASVLDVQGRRAEAAAHYEEALRVSPKFAEAHYRLGYDLALRGGLDEAVKHYREALLYKPAYPEAELNLASVLAAQGKMPEAESHYREALRLKPDFTEAHYNFAVLLASRGKPDEAMEHYGEALRFKPDFPEAHVNLGYLLAGRGRLAEAEAHYREALRLKPDFALAQNNWGTALAAAGNFDGALFHFREALRLAPGYADARKNYDTVLGMKKKK